MNETNVIQNAIQFFNQEMIHFENTVEIEQALTNLASAIASFVRADSINIALFRNHTFIKTLSYGRKIALNDIFQNYEKELLANTTITKDTCTYYPILHDEMLVGILAMEQPQSMESFSMIHDVFCTWLGNRIVKNDNRQQKVMSGLGQDYTAAFLLNLDTDYFEVIINQKTNHSAKQEKLEKWTNYLCVYADKYCIPSSKEAMKEALSTTTLKQRFETVDEFHFTFETTPNDKNQTIFQAHAVKEYGRDGKYAVLGFRCIDEIIRKEREYQKALDNAYMIATRQLDIISNAIPGGIKISNDDETYSFKYVSDQYAAMLGYDSVDEFMESSGGSIAGIAHPEDLESGIAEALRQYQKSDQYAITYRMRCKDGSYKYIEDHGHKVINEDGVVEHWNLILDKNELVQKTIALESEKKANAAKTQFLSRMSHDIRTPLNGIIGLLQIDEKHADDLQMINANRKKVKVAANHLLSLINDILELNKLNSHEVTLAEEVFDAQKVLDEVITISEIKAKEANVTLESNISNCALKYPYLYGSPLHVQQIFLNIISNAIKYNRYNGKVTCTLQEDAQDNNTVMHTITVTDTGVGMNQSFIASIFEPFTQEKQDARSVYQGTGLGMAIVKNLVDRMNGTISIDSHVNQGTTVTICLQYRIAEKPIVHEETKHISYHLEDLHILLAEDNELNREIATFILKDEGVHVTEAKDGREAVATYEKMPAGTFDLILMDVMMPHLNGYEAAKQIRNSHKQDAKTIPIFAMTANAFMEDKQKCYEAGMNEHIAKPLDVNALLEKIQKYTN